MSEAKERTRGLGLGILIVGCVWGCTSGREPGATISGPQPGDSVQVGTLAPAVVTAERKAPSAERRPIPSPEPAPAPGPSAEQLAHWDSLAREVIARDSVARAEHVRDSLRQAAVRDSMARARVAADSALRARAVLDSLAREQARRDSLAAQDRADSLYGVNGAMPRIEGDPNIIRPTVSVEVDAVEQAHDRYLQVQLSYAQPFAHLKASWQLSVPVQHWDSVGGAPKTVTSLANTSITVNRVLTPAAATWKQTLSVTLAPQTGLVNRSVGSDQWIITPAWTASRWFANDRLHFRSLLSWQYGWWVYSANGTKQKNVIIPRLVLTGRVNDKLSATADLRPRIDVTRSEFYSTLMLMLSRPIAGSYGAQAGYEFPLDSLARQHVEKARVYVNVSRTF